MSRYKICTTLIIFLLLICNPVFVNAENGTTINKIVVKGNERVSTNTVLSYAEVEEGDTFSSTLTGNIIKRLYSTKYFDDIDVVLDFNTLIISVKEKPIISEIMIEGNKIVESDDVIEALENVGISRARPFDKNIFDKVEQELVRLYYDRGRYDARIDTSVITLERNRVTVALLIDEGEASTIQGINVIGNKAFNYKQITRLMDSGTAAFYDFWSDKDVYSGPKLQSDLDKIRDFYLNQGYVRFQILSHQVNLSNNNKDIYITISLEEGDVYEFGDLKLYGNTIIPPDDAKAAVKRIVKPGELFSRAKIEVTKNRLSFLLGDKGYAFPEIVAVPIINDETQIVDVEFRVNPGSRTIVRRINITGNENTNDEVYRREIRQFESSLHSNSKIERSKIRLQRLKYVDNVDVKKVRVFDSDDQVDIIFEISERASGEFKVGAGWSDTNGTLFNIKVQQDNFLGTGNNITLDAAQSNVTQKLTLYYTDPYYTPDGISKTNNLVYAETDVSSTSTATYIADTFGGGVFYSTPISETDSFGIGYDLLYTSYTTTLGSPIVVTHHIDEWGKNSLGAKLKATYVNDTRDRTVFARTGVLNSFTADVFLPVTGAAYTTALFKGEYNVPYLFETFGLFDWDTVFRLNTQVGIGAGLFGSTSVPFHSKFFAGGSTSVRGFKAASLGPLTYNDSSATHGCTAKTCDSIGGDFVAVAQFNWVFPPPPMLGIGTRTMRLSLFTDIGNVFEKFNDFEYDELRASYGIQVDFITPVGAVTFGFVDVFKKKAGDDTQPVVFTLGGSF